MDLAYQAPREAPGPQDPMSQVLWFFVLAQPNFNKGYLITIHFDLIVNLFDLIYSKFYEIKFAKGKNNKGFIIGIIY